VTASSTPSLAAGERAALADLLAELGPDAPTCCAGWTTAHLAAHLVVRDRRPDALPGFGLETLPHLRGLGRWSHRLEDRLRTSTPYAEIVDRVRSGPPAWAPMAWPVLADLLNTTEYAIHHEDARRAQPGWAPRVLPRAAQDQLWKAVTFFARRAAGPAGLLLRRSDVPAVEKRIGAGGTTVEGEPLELLLWASGRSDVARVSIS
jgi:uncharacterized protein (TIGR03085 family)